ncbi:MAG: transglutaminase-like domain-containing protein [bacterium]
MTKPLQLLLSAFHTLRFSLLIGLLFFSISASGLKAADANGLAGLDTQMKLAGDAAADWQKMLASAPDEYRASLTFLLENMPEQDLKSLKPEFVLKNVRLAHEARKATPWAAAVPLELFHEQVLPYASINERRDDWREDFMKRFLPMVKELKSAEEAVAKLNIEVFKTFDVKYHATKRPKPDQSPYESIEAKFASCTGLSILLIDACRAVGIPARFVGTPSWTTVRGNHSWVEVFTNQWRFVGACEPSRLDETWFLGNAAKADETNPLNRIYATSYLKTSTNFPLIWNRGVKWVPAEDVTRWYTKRRTLKVAGNAANSLQTLQIRLDGRLVATGRLEKAAEFDLAGGRSYDWQLVDASGKVSKSGKLELPDSNFELKID